MAEHPTGWFQQNFDLLAPIYPVLAETLRSARDISVPSQGEAEELEAFARSQLDRRWNPHRELHIVNRFAGSPLAALLFDKIQKEALLADNNHRMVLLEDRLEMFVSYLRRTQLKTMIESGRCLFIFNEQGRQFPRFLNRYPEMALGEAQYYPGDPTCREEELRQLETHVENKRDHARRQIRHYQDIAQAVGRRPYPKSVYFFVPGHNYLQDACKNAFHRLGYHAERLQWKQPMFRFIRQAAWMHIYKNSSIDLAVFLNSTPAIFSDESLVRSMPFVSVSWFVDNPARVVWREEQLRGCDAVGVFDPVYLPYVKQLTGRPVFELRTGYGIDPTRAVFSEDFHAIDVAFVGELGTQGFLSLEQGLSDTLPGAVELVNRCLKEIDFTQPVDIGQTLRDALREQGYPYRGSLVHFAENKATVLRRRYFLEALTDCGLRVFGDAEWMNPKLAGPLTDCYAGGRIEYSTELPSLYASAKININIFHVQCIQAPNPRVYDVLASGGFLLTTPNRGLNAEFEPGNDFVVFHTKEELREQVRYYLAHPEQRERIARNGRRRALASCGCHDRMQHLLSAIAQRNGERYVYFCR